MKKTLIIIIALGLAGGILFAQAAPVNTPPNTTKPTVSGFQGVGQYVEKEVLIIEFKSMIPATDVFQDKSDTYQHAGRYDFHFTLESLKEKSDILLNKWLKESK
ncbi:MAG: hypothetical protein RBS43_10505 [Candidatus Cloacimonas sp.]|jgi:hypothetical protein|nr:hypothetical protein [Candidatus Cloacimonas sp.]